MPDASVPPVPSVPSVPSGSPPQEDFWAVIPAGGAGTRLWPLSREDEPKFLLDLTGSGRSLLQATVDRLSPLCDQRLIVVTGERHEAAVHRQLPELPRAALLAEPARRDSMAAIGWAAAVVERDDPDAVIGSFAADHVITDEPAFHGCVHEAVVLARQGFLVTLGIQPTEPATGFGYIHTGERLGVAEAPSGRRVQEFVEKPDRMTAQRYLVAGEYLWNAGMFVVKAGVLLDLLATYRPALAQGLRAIAAEPGRLGEIWADLERIAIDHAVAEPAAAEGRVAVIPVAFDWDDIGDFASLHGLLSARAEVEATAAAEEAGDEPPALIPGSGVLVLGDDDDVLSMDSSGVVVPAGGRLVAVLGVPDIVVVDTGTAVLVTRVGRAQDVKLLVDRLGRTGHTDLT